MKDRSTRTLLVVLIALLAANLLVTLLVHTATPAQAQGNRVCVGMTSAWMDEDKFTLFRVWSDGKVEFSAGRDWKEW